MRYRTPTLRCLLAVFFISFAAPHVAANEQDTIVVGVDVDISSGSGPSGIAIQRGAELAIDEINASGGVLGRKLALAVRDHRGNPARGIDNIEYFASRDDVVAVLGGLHTPVAMSELPIIHEKEIVYLSPWAAGTPVVQNGYVPNFVFRVSVRDQFAGPFLVREGMKIGAKRFALALENTGWGRSNEKAMRAALQEVGLEPVAVTWFHWGTKDDHMKNLFEDITAAKADIILLVANAPEGITFLKHLAETPSPRPRVLSHWGITGGSFFTQAKDPLQKVQFSFLQTYSFIKPKYPDRAQGVISAYIEKYEDANSTRDIFAPAGTAHAYDIIHLLAKAIVRAGSTDRRAVRQALENLEHHQGLVRNYAPPFEQARHDALNASDFSIATFDADGVIVPVQ